MEETRHDFSVPRKQFSRIGLALAVILAVSTLIQVLLRLAVEYFPGFETFLIENTWAETLLGLIPMYFVAIPLGLLLLKKLPGRAPAPMGLRPVYFLEYIPISLFITYCGSFVGMGLSYLITGGTAINPVEAYLQDNTLLKILGVVVIAPVVEEYVFRKTLIDHSLPYGEKGAILLSAVTFGLLHQNFFQFFYAAGLGLLLGYIYVRTGKLWYTVLLHAIMNFMGGVIAPLLAPVAEMAADPETITVMDSFLIMIAGLYAFALIGLAIFGLVRLIIRCTQLRWAPTEEELPGSKGFATRFLNPGMILYTLLCLAAMVASLYP